MAKSDQVRPLNSGDSVFVDELCLRRSHSTWPFADRHRAEIAAHWARASAKNPHIFNGTILPLLDCGISGSRFHGHYAESDFASYLYWRETGFCDPPTCDGFGSVLVQSPEGRYLFAMAADHTLNGGLWVPPGGMIDQRDVADDGSIDAWQYGLRELAEETGLLVGDVEMETGHQVAKDGALVACGLFCRTKVSEEDVLARFRHHNRSLDDMPELDDVAWFSKDEALARTSVPQYVKLLLRGWSDQVRR